MSRPELKAVHHLNVVVSDLERSLAFYTEKLGLEVRDRLRVGEPELGRGLGVPGADIEAAFLSLPGTDATIEMVCYVTPRSPAGEPDAPASTPGFGHLAFQVPDIEAAHAALVGEGVAFVSTPVTVAGGTRFCFFRDPDGNILELIQPA